MRGKSLCAQITATAQKQAARRGNQIAENDAWFGETQVIPENAHAQWSMGIGIMRMLVLYMIQSVPATRKTMMISV